MNILILDYEIVLGLCISEKLHKSIGFTRPIKVASSLYSTTTTIAIKWINGFAVYVCID